jgi:hypothetical protein
MPYAFDQLALATGGLHKVEGLKDSLAIATIGLMCLTGTPSPPSTGSGNIVVRPGGLGGGSIWVVPPCTPEQLDEVCPPEPVQPEDVPLDIAVDTAGDLTKPHGKLVSDLALLFKKPPR